MFYLSGAKLIKKSFRWNITHTKWIRGDRFMTVVEKKEESRKSHKTQCSEISLDEQKIMWCMIGFSDKKIDTFLPNLCFFTGEYWLFALRLRLRSCSFQIRKVLCLNLTVGLGLSKQLSIMIAVNLEKLFNKRQQCATLHRVKWGTIFLSSLVIFKIEYSH